MSLSFERFQCALDGVGHAGFFHDKGAAHIDDCGDVLDEDGTGFDAGAAGAASPEGFVAHDSTDHRRFVVEAEVEVVALNEIGDFLLADGSGVGLEVLDDVHRRKRLAGDVGGAVVGAAAAAHADVELEQLLHREVLELGNAEVFLLFNVLDHVEFARRGRALEEGVGWGEDEVIELRVTEQRDPGERADHVDPPEGGVDVECSGDLHAGEHQGDDVADRRPIGPLGVGVDLGGVDTQSLDQESGDQQRAEAADDQPVLPGRQPGGARPDPAMGDRHADTDDPDQAKDVGDERVAEVTRADEDVNRDVIVDREQGGDQKEHDHRGHDAEVHHARVRIAEHALGAGATLEHASQALRQVVECEVGLAQAPDSRAADETVDDDPDHEWEQHVEHPEVVDVEEQLAVRASDADGLGARDEGQPTERQPGRNRQRRDALGPRARPSPASGLSRSAHHSTPN